MGQGQWENRASGRLKAEADRRRDIAARDAASDGVGGVAAAGDHGCPALTKWEHPTRLTVYSFARSLTPEPGGEEHFEHNFLVLSACCHADVAILCVADEGSAGGH